MTLRMFALLTSGMLVFPGWAQPDAASPEENVPSLESLRQALRNARHQYREGSEGFDAAAETFQEVEASEDDQEFNLDALRLAQGLSRLQAGNPDGALEALNRIQGFPEADERSRHRLLKGVAHLEKGAALAKRAQWEDAISEARNGIESLSESLRDRPDSEVIRKNLELAHRQLERYLARRPPPTPTPTPEPTPTPTPTPPPESTPTPTPEPTPTPDPEDQNPQDPTPTPDPEGQQSPESQQNQGEEDSQQQEPQSGDPQQDESADETNAEQQQQRQEELEAEEARQLLDAFQQQEKAQRRELLRRKIRGIPVEKDW